MLHAALLPILSSEGFWRRTAHLEKEKLWVLRKSRPEGWARESGRCEVLESPILAKDT